MRNLNLKFVSIAFFLGLFGLGMLMETRQIALYVGFGLMAVGLALFRSGKRKPGLLLAAVGALLVTYGLGYIG